MAKNENIRISLQIPSVSLKQFIERAIRDDDFFSRAIENPLGSMQECGVNLAKSAFTPDHFATFFGALAGVRDAVRRKGEEKLSFEQIFGHSAQIRGAVISAEMNQGFCKEWDNRGAFAQKMQSLTSAQTFDRDSDICGVGPSISGESLNVMMERGGVTTTFPSQETSHHTRTEWSTNEFQMTDRRSDAGTSSSFEKDGQGFMALLNGPLTHPIDLAVVTARLETFAELAGGKTKAGK